MPAPLASPHEIDMALGSLAGWVRMAGQLRVAYQCASGEAAARFAAAVGAIAAELAHRPECTVCGSIVRVTTTTAAAGGITDTDLALAARVAAAAAAAGLASTHDIDAAGPWMPVGHYYSPVTSRAEVEADAARLFATGLQPIAGVDQDLPGQLTLALELARFHGEEDFPEHPRADRRYGWANDYFPYDDAFTYYALLRHLQPRRVIEVGAGWSSAVLLDTDERFLGQRIAATFVEPFPERLLSLLRPADLRRTRLLRRRVQDVPLDEFTALAANDILFVDSSHVAKTGSDVLHTLFTILPALQSGVWVHVHDVHANFEYPATWVREGRSWNEAYFVRAFLMHNSAWQIALHGATLALYAPGELQARLPRLGKRTGGSLWLRKR
jgi:pterin-4a-carbinolamine dehydratase